MAPLGTIGNSLTHGTMRMIATAIAPAFAMQGSILGPASFFNVQCSTYFLDSVPLGMFGIGYGLLKKKDSALAAMLIFMIAGTILVLFGVID